MFCTISIGTSIKDFHQEKRTKIFSEGCDTFGPKRPQLIGPTGQTVPNQLCSYGPMVPKNLVSMDKWSPTNLVPLDKRFPSNLVPLDKWSPANLVPISPDHHSLSKQNILGTICPGGPIWLGTICSRGPKFWGPFVHEDRIGWGPIVQRDQLWGTKYLGTICVWDQMCHSLNVKLKYQILDFRQLD